jgi:hypothetical protein
VKHRLREFHLVEAKIGNRRPQGRIADRESYGNPQGEQTVHQSLAEFRLLGKPLIQMQRLGIHGKGGKEHIVHFGDCSSRLMFEDLSDGKFLKVLPGHGVFAFCVVRSRCMSSHILHQTLLQNQRAGTAAVG